MKHLLWLGSLVLSSIGFSQTMTLEKNNSNFPEMEDLVFFDFDQDGDEDLAGIEGSILRFYIKDSLADFALSSTEFTVTGDRLVVEDFDLDGKLDVLVSGMDNHKVYLSNGNGTFMYSSIYDIVDTGNKEYHDMDGDGDLDLVLSNMNMLPLSSLDEVKIYENMNTTGFSAGIYVFENTDSIISQRIGIGDINHDGVNDIFRTGFNSVDYSDTILYYFSNSNLTISQDSSIETSIALSYTYKMADFNDDGFDDVLSETGVLLFDPISDDYVFSQYIYGWNPSSYQEIIDINNDGHLDIFINHEGSAVTISIHTVKIFINSGDGTFTQPYSSNNFSRTLGQAFDVSDIDNDGDFDILYNGEYQYNFVDGQFGIVEAKPLTLYNNFLRGFEHSSYRNGLDFKDVDNDGDLDMLQIGYRNNFPTKSFFYENKGNENSRYVFEEKPNTLNASYRSGKCSLDDINGDGNVDIFVFGQTAIWPKSSYKEGNGLEFNSVGYNENEFNSSFFWDHEWVSLTNDSLLDFVYVSMSSSVPTLFFRQQIDSLEFESMSMDSIPFQGDFKFIDLDNDGDKDLITGGGLQLDLVTNHYATYYENTGLGNFVEIPNVFPNDLQMNNIQFADADMDGDIDIFTASKGLFTHFNILLQQPGMTFEYDSIISSIPQVNFEFELVDIDGDLDIDIGLIPLADNSSFKMFIQDSNDYQSMSITGFTNTYSKGFVKFLHMNGDSILDIFIADEQHVDLYFHDVCQATFQKEIINQCSSFTSPVSDSSYNVSGVYYEILSVLNDNGCDSIVEWNITINNTSLTDSLTINSCTPYESPFNLDIWEETGIYTDSNTNIYGCDSIVVYNFTHELINTDIHQSTPNELTTYNTAEDIQWLDCNDNYSPIVGEVSQSFTPLSNGSYAIKFSNSNCVDTSACFNINTVGLFDYSVINSIVTPNPFADELNLNLNGLQSIWISDLGGKVVYRTNGSNGSGNFIISTLNWQSGLYLIYIEHENKIEIAKLIKY